VFIQFQMCEIEDKQSPQGRMIVYQSHRDIHSCTCSRMHTVPFIFRDHASKHFKKMLNIIPTIRVLLARYIGEFQQFGHH